MREILSSDVHHRRSLLLVGGWLLHGLFGTTTDTDPETHSETGHTYGSSVAQVAIVARKRRTKDLQVRPTCHIKPRPNW